MGLMDRLTGIGTGLWLERPAGKLAPAEITDRLELNGKKLERSFATAGDTPANRRLLRHITGIERWGQSRLRVALGNPLTMDEYDDYRPPKDANWIVLQETFQQTRQETVALARQLADANALGVKIPHNQFGPLSGRGWLQYLDTHANWEAKKMR